MCILNAHQEEVGATFDPGMVKLFAAVIRLAILDCECGMPPALMSREEEDKELVADIKGTADWFINDPESPFAEWAVLTGHPVKEIRRRLKAGETMYAGRWDRGKGFEG